MRSHVKKHEETASGRGPVSILLIEDNPADSGLVREALEEHGVEGELVVLFDGDQAIRFLEAIDSGQETSPDLIILDLNLPKRPGREVLTSIRLSAKCHKIPVAILTSSGAIRDRSDAERLGASRYIVKPLRLEEFIALGDVFREMLAGGPRH